MTSTATTTNTYTTTAASAHTTLAAHTILLLLLLQLLLVRLLLLLSLSKSCFNVEYLLCRVRRCWPKVCSTAGQVLFTFRSGVHPASYAALRATSCLLFKWLSRGLVYPRASLVYSCSPTPFFPRLFFVRVRPRLLFARPPGVRCIPGQVRLPSF